MGWGPGKFPIFSQLNAITSSPARRDAVHDYFVANYDAKNPYTVGDLCYDWRPNGEAHQPPWTAEEYDRADAEGWKQHCHTDLDVPNITRRGPTGNTVKADLTAWISEAIQNKEKIVYVYRQSNGLGDPDRDNGPDNPRWNAELQKTGGAGTIRKWHITVTGPGF